MKNKKIITEVNQKTLAEALESIGYKIDGVDEINLFIYTPTRKTPFRVVSDRIELTSAAFRNDMAVAFYFEGSEITIWEGCVSIGTKECFVQFYKEWS